MAVLPKADVVFVGFGMVGGIIANELTKRATNLKLVALERGPFRNTYPDFIVDHFDEWRFSVQGELFQDLSRETVTFRNDLRQRALPMRQLGSFLPGDGVGGAMVHWNGQLWRFLPHFFEYRTHLEQRYGRNFLPEDTTIQDWGITYDELEPYYTQFDKTFGVAGKAGNLKGQPYRPGGNPFEGMRSEEYPQGPNTTAYGTTLFRDACTQLGYKPFPQPTCNSPAEYKNPDGQTLAPCNYCGFCERFGCHVGAKASPINTVIPNALKSGRVEVRPMANVFRINHSGGRATSVSYYDADGIEQEQPGDLIVVGTFTLNNIRLMLLSGIGEVYDPQTGRGVVGRNYTYQVGGAGASAWFSDKIMNRFMGSGANGWCIDDFNSDNFDHSGLGFFGGGCITSNNTGARPIGSLGLPPGSPTWGSGWKSAAKQWYNRQVAFGMQGESPAYRQNYADLDPTYRDAFGNPLLRITFNFTDNERKMVKWVGENVMPKLVDQMNPTQKAVTSTITDYSIVPYQSTHVEGGTIMGADPTTSAVNKYCQVWNMPNLFVVGASNFPQNAGYNPTGTAGALAFHVADALVTRYLPSPGLLA